jgi:hypothetical protein
MQQIDLEVCRGWQQPKTPSPQTQHNPILQALKIIQEMFCKKINQSLKDQAESEMLQSKVT